MTERVRGRANQMRRAFYFANKPFCVHCEQQGKTTIARELDHIIPLSKGGEDIEDNWQGLCIECHKAKTRQDNGWKEKPIIGEDGWPVSD